MKLFEIAPGLTIVFDELFTIGLSIHERCKQLTKEIDAKGDDLFDNQEGELKTYTIFPPKSDVRKYNIKDGQIIRLDNGERRKLRVIEVPDGESEIEFAKKWYKQQGQEIPGDLSSEEFELIDGSIKENFATI